MASASNLLLVCVIGISLSFARGQSSGNAACPCLSSSASGSTGAAYNQPTIAGEVYDYGSNYGYRTCAAHDSGLAPFCNGASPPGWCEESWCYVDPRECDQGLPPFQSQYFEQAFYSYQTCGTQNTFDSWFRASGSTESHELTELATLATGYVRGIVSSLEDNEAELRGLSASTSCTYDATCPCCGCVNHPAWGSAPPLTFQQTLTLPLGNGDLPGVDACLGDIVGDAFRRVAATEAAQNRVGFEYYGSTRGTYMQWPGMSDCSDSYDPRFREWFAGAAAGPKDVVIVVDTSGSMSGGRMSLAINAAKQVVNTLTDADYATVIGFSTNAYKMGNTLQRATRANRESMRSWIDSNMQASGGTNFRAAFQAVKDVLTATPTASGCNRVILFLSDGEPSAWTESDYATTRSDLASLGQAHLLTYALGSGADSRVLKNLACQNGGILYEVADDANLGDIMAEYYKLLAPMMEPCLARWISYQDVYTNQELLGVCIAAYSKQSNSDPNTCSVEAGSGTAVGSGPADGLPYYLVPELIGVACIDMSLIASESDLRANSGWSAFEERIQAERSACPTRTLTEGQMETLRKRVSTTAVCDAGTSIPAAATDEPTYRATGSARPELECQQSGGGIPVGGIVGIVIGAVIGVLVICSMVLFCKKRKPRAPPPAKQDNPSERPSQVVQPIQVNIQMAQPQPAPVVMAQQPVMMMAQPVMAQPVMAQPAYPRC